MNSGYAPGPVQYNPPQESWFSRNWGWFIPLIIAVVLSFVGGLLFFIFGLMKSSDPYKHAVDLAMHDPQATSALGAPVKPGWFVSGSIKLTGSSGTADLSIPVRGQLHKGTVYVLARKFAGKWSYQKIILLVDGQEEEINLLPHAVAPGTEN